MPGSPRSIRILGTGEALPRRRVTAAEIDALAGVEPGWTLRTTEVAVRHFVDGESSSELGARACKRALDAAGLTVDDVDLIVCGNSVGQQPIPCTAAWIQRELGRAAHGIPCFDVNATCLSFLVALDLAAHAIGGGAYRRALIVSSEVASLGVDWSHPESAALFGDGAAAAVIGCPEAGESGRILASRMETWSGGAELAQITHGGSKRHFREFDPSDERGFLFHMDGPGLLRLSHRTFPPFLDRLLADAGLTLHDIALVIPHQANAKAMRLVQRRLRIRDDQMLFILRERGNTISATLPMALHAALEGGRVGRGDRVLLVGTSAGFSLGGMVLEL